MNRFSLLAAAILLEVLGTLSLRAMVGLAQPWWLVGAVAGIGLVVAGVLVVEFGARPRAAGGG